MSDQDKLQQLFDNYASNYIDFACASLVPNMVEISWMHEPTSCLENRVCMKADAAAKLWASLPPSTMDSSHHQFPKTRAAIIPYVLGELLPNNRAVCKSELLAPCVLTNDEKAALSKAVRKALKDLTPIGAVDIGRVLASVRPFHATPAKAVAQAFDQPFNTFMYRRIGMAVMATCFEERLPAFPVW